MGTIATPMIWGRTATTRSEALEELSQRQALRVLLPRTGMDCMTWQGMYFSGAGIGMGRLMREERILVEFRQARSVCYGGAVGTSTRPTSGLPGAGTTSRRFGRTGSGSVPSCSQVSELAAGRRGGVVAEWRNRGRWRGTVVEEARAVARSLLGATKCKVQW